MRIMGLDVGDKNIGIAVSDSLLLTAQGRPTLRRTNWAQDVGKLRAIVQEDEIERIVVGQPLHMSGEVSRQSQKVASFAGKLEKSLGIPVVFWDERLTSFAAEEHLEQMGLNWRERRKHVDKIAAMFILQSYLDSQDRPKTSNS
jgi:putative holliday junction resolvase